MSNAKVMFACRAARKRAKALSPSDICCLDEKARMTHTITVAALADLCGVTRPP